LAKFSNIFTKDGKTTSIVAGNVIETKEVMFQPQFIGWSTTI